MKSKEPQNIDQLFREGLNPEYDPVSYNDEDWRKLEMRLEQYSNSKSIALWLSPIGGIAALIILAFSLWMLWPTPEESTTEQFVQKEAVTEEEKSIPDPPSELKEQVLDSAIQPQQILQPLPSGESKKKPHSQIALNKAQEPTDKERTPDSSLRLREKLPAKFSDDELPDTNELRQSKEYKKPQETNQVAAHPLQLDADQKGRQLALSLLVAPAYNGVDNLNDGSFGGDIGVLVSWNLTPKWQVSTGAVYAKKLYETNLNNYNNEVDYAAQTVDADCRVLDIPLNIQYALLKSGKTTIHIGTGISSYLMLKEDYYFEDTSSYAQNSQEVHLTNENQHWLSVLNFQMSVQQQISSRVSINLQPFVKLPTQDIGYAKVRLQSYGMALSASWTL
ncbi:porin family protein [Sunxiuqinia elliptica]|uniref:Outer membrane protein beta-barrel domain-containing protein n=1 Tax=Sunxiuqinia elliptica TaxID=655355 RepID=A0A1I2BSB4_9BACT|nr:outer membrane beta-barrel protein [Sunxiuqinia elliptica]SFE58989.1 Outer membrane protein beta-barrel domain-containing protein [Sunxiuqinia elliptica]